MFMVQLWACHGHAQQFGPISHACHDSRYRPPCATRLWRPPTASVVAPMTRVCHTLVRRLLGATTLAHRSIAGGACKVTCMYVTHHTLLVGQDNVATAACCSCCTTNKTSSIQCVTCAHEGIPSSACWHSCAKKILTHARWPWP